MAPGDAFTSRQQRRITDALDTAATETGLHWSLFVGDLAGEHRAVCERLHAALADDEAVLVVVSPGQRVVEVVTGELAAGRVPDRACALAVLSMTSTFAGGDLAGGIITGLRMLAETAGAPEHLHSTAVNPPRPLLDRVLGH